MSITAEEAAEGTSLLIPQEAPSTAEPRACARASVAPGEVPSPSVITDGMRRAGRAAVRAAAVLDNPGSLIHSQPPTFRQAWDRHAECARHYEALALRWPRYWWGLFHLLAVMPPLYLALWLLESPARFLVAAAIITVIWWVS